MTSLALQSPLARETPQGRGLWSAILGVPLLGKLLGANLLFVFAGLGAHLAFPSAPAAELLASALGASFLATGMLVWLALRPVAQLEETAERVSRGEFDARVPWTRLADRNLNRLSFTMNRLLDRVAADRARINYLAGRSVRARDIERESVARELRDSFAQTLAAISYQIEATRRVNADAAVADQLERTRDLVRQLTEEMRGVAETLYPGTLAEFGLCNALDALARRMSRRTRLGIEVDTEEFDGRVDTAAAAALYRVADEALRNVEMHANATHARVRLQTSGGVVLEIEDDGRGVDMTAGDPLQAGLGLFSAKAVLALVGGELQISSAPNRGTRVTARVPSSGRES